MRHSRQRHVLAAVFFAVFVFSSGAQEEEDGAVPPESGIADEITLDSLSYAQRQAITRNQYLVESITMANNARLALLEGDYDASIWYSAEALRLAELSDEYITNRLRYLSALKKLSEAADRLSWAESSGAADYYPDEVERARVHLGWAKEARRAEDWGQTLALANEAIADLANVAAPPPHPEKPDFSNQPKQPALYTVRPWDVYGDCLWNISKWFYKTPWRWPLIYERNRDKLPDPGNPNIVEIGTVLELPSLGGEARDGMWDTGRPYPAESSGEN